VRVIPLGRDFAIGSLTSYIIRTKIFSTILNAEETLNVETASSCPPPAPLVSSIIRRAQLNSQKYKSANLIIPLFLEIYDASPELNSFLTGKTKLREWRESRKPVIGGRFCERPLASFTEGNIFEACEAAVNTFWYLVDGSSPVQEKTLHSLLMKLKLAVGATDPLQWMSFSQEALIWICAIGAAISRTAYESWWFIMRGGAVVMSTKLLHGSVFEESWFAFRWLRQLYRKRVMV
jgi:hypothetical protein